MANFKYKGLPATRNDIPLRKEAVVKDTAPKVAAVKEPAGGKEKVEKTSPQDKKK